MNADDLKQLTTDALDRLSTLLDAGHSDQLTALLKTMGRFHRYSFNNICLITSQCPAATRVAGFRTWRTLGRCVRKGEKGIAILAPIVRRRDADASDDDARHVAGFRAAHVFDGLSRDSDHEYWSYSVETRAVSATPRVWRPARASPVAASLGARARGLAGVPAGRARSARSRSGEPVRASSAA